MTAARDGRRQSGREARAAALERHVRETVRRLPPLPPAKRDRLALLLRGGGSA